MGYHKNQLIAEQVEVGDRIPEPKPAYMHVAYPTRATNKLARQVSRRWQMKMRRQLILDAVVYTTIGLALGLFLGWAVL